MYKNQLQELAQRSCFNLPSYTCIREGPDHAPRFKATVNFNGEVFESPAFCTTLRQAEHSAAEIALGALAQRGPSHSLAAKILDETGVYKNLLQEVAQRVGAPLPSYTTVRSGLGHLPVFTCTVELGGIEFTGEPAKNKKQAEKNAASAAWSSLKQLAQEASSSANELDNSEEQEQIRIARALLNYRQKEKIAMANNPHASPFPKKFPMQLDKRPSQQSSHSSYSKILPLIRPKSVSRSRPDSPSSAVDGASPSVAENHSQWPPRFPAIRAAPYIPIRHFQIPSHGMAPPVTVRTAIPVFSAPPHPSQQLCPPQIPHVLGHQSIRMASPVRIRPAVPVYAVPPPVQRVNTMISTHESRPAVGLFDTIKPPPKSETPKKELPTCFSREVMPTTASVTALHRANEMPVPVASPTASSVPVSTLTQQHKEAPVAVESPTAPPSASIATLNQAKEAAPAGTAPVEESKKEIPQVFSANASPSALAEVVAALDTPEQPKLLEDNPPSITHDATDSKSDLAAAAAESLQELKI